MTRVSLLLAGSVAAVLLTAGIAEGMGTETATSRVTLKSPAPSTFKGKVSSSSGSCIKERSVKLFQSTSSGAQLVSQGVSDDRGIYRIGLEGTHVGDYHAKVKSKHVSSLVCKAARSKQLHIPG